MKKLINDPRNVVREMLEGAVQLAPGQTVLEGEMVVIRSSLPVTRRVALLSGGGSGHEPAHAGYVGAGMLTAAIAGDVFTSPSTDAVFAAINAVAGPAGAVIIVKNYTGDRLNFGLAAEMARAQEIPAEIVVVADDVALRDLVDRSRRRGIAGTILIHKIAGAAAESGMPLVQVATLAREAAHDLGSMGVSLGACTLPAAGRPGFVLGESEIELGLGIHGEAGVERSVMRPADELVEIMLNAIIADLELTSGERVALLVNGLGATPPMELNIVARAALSKLRDRGVVVERAWAGTFLSALDMPGCSLSLMRVDDARLELLDAPTDAPAWPGSGLINSKPIRYAPRVSRPEESNVQVSPGGRQVQAAAFAVADALLAGEALLTDLDTKTGDGDLGSSMARGALAIRSLPDSAWRSSGAALASIGDALRREIAGSSGPFYATGLLRASRRLGDEPSKPGDWVDAFAEAVNAVAELGGAKPGDRSMLDALHPAAQAMASATAEGKPVADVWRAGLTAARTGAQATTDMMPRLGRASYLGARALGTPDGGAVAVSLWFAALAKACASVE